MEVRELDARPVVGRELEVRRLLPFFHHGVEPIRSRAVRDAHGWVGLAVIVIAALAAAVALAVYRLRPEAGHITAHLLALAQTIVIAQVGLGLLLLSDDRRTRDDLHYVYGTLSLLVVLSPWFYAPEEPRRRLLWFAGATLLAGALAVRAYTTAG